MSKLKLPTSVIIFGRVIPIEITEEKIFNDKGEELDGDTDGMVIRISGHSLKKDRGAILLHEMWHCFIRRTGQTDRLDHNHNLEEQNAEGFQTIVLENFILRNRN